MENAAGGLIFQEMASGHGGKRAEIYAQRTGVKVEDHNGLDKTMQWAGQRAGRGMGIWKRDGQSGIVLKAVNTLLERSCGRDRTRKIGEEMAWFLCVSDLDPCVPQGRTEGGPGQTSEIMYDCVAVA